MRLISELLFLLVLFGLVILSGRISNAAVLFLAGEVKPPAFEIKNGVVTSQIYKVEQNKNKIILKSKE